MMRVVLGSCVLFSCCCFLVQTLDHKFTGSDSRELVNINDTFYYISDIDGDYPEAVRTCNSLGMSLVSLDNEEKQNMVVGYLNNNGHGAKPFWTSGINVFDSTYLWSGTGRMFKYSNWEAGEPDSYDISGDVFVGMHPASKSHQWYDTLAQSTLFFICEQ